MTIGLYLMILILEGMTAELSGKRWNLVEIDGQPIGGTGGSEDRGPHLILDAEMKRVSGSGGCNRFHGPFELEEGSLRFGPLASTRMACAEGMDVEVKFFKALDAVDGYRIEGETLVLRNADGKTLLRFRAASDK